MKSSAVRNGFIAACSLVALALFICFYGTVNGVVERAASRRLLPAEHVAATPAPAVRASRRAVVVANSAD